MEKNAGGAKPKTGTGAPNSQLTQGSYHSAETGRQYQESSSQNTSDNRRNYENGTVQGNRSPQSPVRDRSNNNTSDETNTGGDNEHVSGHRSSLPNSVARNRPLVSQMRNTSRRTTAGEHSPSIRTYPGISGHLQNTQRTHQRPSLRPRLGNPSRLSEASRRSDAVKTSSFPTDSSSNSRRSNMMDVGDNSNTLSTFALRPGIQETGTGNSISGEQLSSQTSADRPMSVSRDALFAHRLLQEEMDDLIRTDEELARELHEELNVFPDNPFQFDSRDYEEESTETDIPPHAVRPRGRHYSFLPFGPTELHHRTGRGWGGMRTFMGLPGGQSGGRALPDRFRNNLGNLRGRGSGQSSPDADLPQGEFDPEERLLEGGHPEDFLSIMQDPSLMLLMLLLRTPDSFNEGGVDLEDYDGLWELAERLGEVRRRGITDDDINRIPTHDFRFEPEGSNEDEEAGAVASDGSGSQCQICLVNFENGDSLRSIPCRHDFHRDCIDEWLKRNATCPICRHDIKPS